MPCHVPQKPFIVCCAHCQRCRWAYFTCVWERLHLKAYTLQMESNIPKLLNESEKKKIMAEIIDYNWLWMKSIFKTCFFNHVDVLRENPRPVKCFDRGLVDIKKKQRWGFKPLANCGSEMYAPIRLISHVTHSKTYLIASWFMFSRNSLHLSKNHTNSTVISSDYLFKSV